MLSTPACGAFMPQRKTTHQRMLTLGGAFQITLGVMAIAFGGAALGVKAQGSVVAAGIWSGVILIISGAFGVASGSRDNKCLRVASMVMSLISAVAALAMMILAAIGLKHDVRGYYCSGYYPHYCYDSRRIAMNAVLVAVSILAGVTSVLTSVAGCCGCCCSTPTRPSAHPTGTGESRVVHLVEGGQTKPMLLVTPSGGNATTSFVIPLPEGAMTNSLPSHRSVIQPSPGLSNPQMAYPQGAVACPPPAYDNFGQKC